MDKSSSDDFAKKFFLMAENGDLEGLENVFESQPKSISKKLINEAFYKCCLNYKVMGQHEDCLNLCLRKNADIDAFFRDTNLSPLMVCAQKGYGDLVQFLIDNGAHPNNSSRADRKTALFWAIDTNSGENINIVSMFLESEKCNVNQMSTDGCTPLTLALDRNQQKTIKI